MKIKLTNKEIREYLNIETPEFPKYVTQIINLASQNAQATRPKTVGQMSELIQEFPGRDVSEWEEWYINNHPGVIKKATEKILKMVRNFKEAMDRIDEKMIEKWVKDLVIIKTFMGLKFQEAVLKKGAEIKDTDYRRVESIEESKGIDGYIGDIPVSIKPDTYKVKASLQEHITAKMIYYRKLKDGIEVDYSEIL